MKLKLTVAIDRRYVGKLFVPDGTGSDTEIPVSAKGSEELGAPDPPTGTYRLLKVVHLPPEDQKAVQTYGEAIILFEAVGGNALRYPNKGKSFVLALHGGEGGLEGELLATEGSLRVSDDNLEYILSRLRGEKDVTLEMTEEKVGLIRRVLGNKISRASPSAIRSFSNTSQSDSDSGPNVWFWLWLMDNHNHCQHHDALPSEVFRGGGGHSGGAGAGSTFTLPEDAHEVREAEQAAAALSTVSQLASAASDEVVGAPLIVEPFAASHQTPQNYVEIASGETPAAAAEPTNYVEIASAAPPEPASPELGVPGY